MVNLKKIALPAVVAMAGLTGIAGASLASGLAASADTTATTTASTTSTAAADTTADSTSTSTSAAAPSGPHTANGITETVLTGDTYTQAVAAAQAAEPGATVDRAETDADGAKYEVHMTKSDGTKITVKLDENFKVTSTEDGMR